MTYRPTVRYPDFYKDYVESVYQSTTLDRNQILRLTLFIAAHSPEYIAILKKYKIDDVPLPHPDWGRDDDHAWKDQNYIKKQTNRPKQTDTPPPVIKDKRVIPNPPLIKIKDQGGIQFKIG